ncbi:fibrinogen-like protein 1 [Drosophila rhopaloa]|uniref:Fibrinogen C-terminal domain-containing protein n=1 Tax=Drosophila rhopaloa TaxID=1041015 RepID=A0ABM5JEZ0_DRORH|nr:fibrinogen-like protein 1 [Drosophila rhopaloa]
MLRLLPYLLGLLIFPSVQGGIVLNSKDQSLCVLQDPPTQCGSFCLAALNPLFVHSRNIRKRLDEIEAGQTALRDSFRMTTAQGQEDLKAGMKNQLQELITKKDFANSIKALQAKLDAGFNRVEELRTMKITADANDELKSQVNSLKDTITDLQSQLKTSKVKTKNKEDILKVKEEHLKNRDEQISDFTTRIKAIEKSKSELSSQLSEYQIKLREMEPFKVSCASSPPGWTVIQRRIDGSVNFRRTWEQYKNGFGNARGEFFIGLEKLHRMTETRAHELYIKLGKVDGSTSYAHYDDFKIGSEEELYEVKNLGKYSGEAGDFLTNKTNQKFSTFDRDNDNSDKNCAHGLGAWWHNKCSSSYLNGKYFKDGKGYGGISWGSWHNHDWRISLTFSEMMIRPKSL